MDIDDQWPQASCHIVIDTVAEAPVLITPNQQQARKVYGPAGSVGKAGVGPLLRRPAPRGRTGQARSQAAAARRRRPPFYLGPRTGCGVLAPRIPNVRAGMLTSLATPLLDPPVGIEPRAPRCFGQRFFHRLEGAYCSQSPLMRPNWWRCFATSASRCSSKYWISRSDITVSSLPLPS